MSFTKPLILHLTLTPSLYLNLTLTSSFYLNLTLTPSLYLKLTLTSSLYRYPAGIITQARWDRIFQEKLEMNVLKSDLRHFRVPPYFESKFGETFLASLLEGPNMGALSEQVPSPGSRSPVCDNGECAL